MYLLGISCYYHDAAAVLLKDGFLAAAAEEERFSRIKHDYGFPRNAIHFCLEQGGIEGRDPDYVVFFEKPFRKLDRILMTTLGTYPKSCRGLEDRKSCTSWGFPVTTTMRRRCCLRTGSLLPLPKKSAFRESNTTMAFLGKPFTSVWRRLA